MIAYRLQMDHLTSSSQQRWMQVWRWTFIRTTQEPAASQPTLHSTTVTPIPGDMEHESGGKLTLAMETHPNHAPQAGGVLGGQLPYDAKLVLA